MATRGRPAQGSRLRARAESAVVSIPRPRRGERLELGRVVPSARSVAVGLALLVAAGAVYLAARSTDLFAVRTITVAGATGEVARNVRAALAPADGLDPLIQRAFEHVLADVRQQGATVFMSSHDLAEVERTCDRVAIIREGRIVAEETIDELRSRHRRTAEVVFRNDSPAEIDSIPGVELIALEARRAVLSLEGSVAPLLAFLAERGDVEDLLLTRPSLEDIFLGYYDVSRKGAGREVTELDQAESNVSSGLLR